MNPRVCSERCHEQTRVTESILEKEYYGPWHQYPFTMSRLCVKNLPKYLKEDRLREIFGAKGEITDVKILHRSDGKSRCFGFVGFKSETEAQAAIHYFDRSYIDTSKISVTEALPAGSTSLPTPKSKLSLNKMRSATGANAVSLGQAKGEGRQHRPKTDAEAMLQRLQDPDSELKEFLSVHESRTKERVWANDQDAIFEIGGKGKRVKAKKAKPVAVVEQVASRKRGGEGVMLTRTRVKFSASDDEEEEALLSSRGEVDEKKGVSDLEWLQGKVSAGLEGSSPAEESESEEAAEDVVAPKEDEDEVVADAPPVIPEKEDAKAPPSALDAEERDLQQLFTTSTSHPPPKPLFEDDEAVKRPAATHSHPDLSSVEPVEQSGRIFVRNLPYTATEEDLTKLFGSYGQLTEVHIPLDRETRRPRGTAFILFLIPEHAKKALEALDGSIFQGRLLHLLPAKPMPASEVRQSFAKTSYKKKKEADQKAEAGREHNWNTLFLRSDTVVSALARELGVDKSDMLSPEADNVAVRVALGEVHILRETQSFLEAQGVNVSAFEQGPPDERVQWTKKPRSKTVLLGKNLAPDISEEDLRNVFGRYGTLARLVLPPSKTIVLVEYVEPSEARKAFRSLALRPLNHIPLYLEWAPTQAFTGAAPPTAVAPVKDEQAAEMGEDGEEALAGAETTTLFVKNLNFSTGEDALRRLFGKLGDVRAVTIARKPDAKHKGKLLSMGYGFVEYQRRQDAERALKEYQGTVVDGHTLNLKYSDKRLARPTAGKEEAAPTTTSEAAPTAKLLLRNVPFEASKREILDLCKNFGQVKSVRLPKKIGGGHRGFAFVEFLTPQEAKHAKEALAHAHFYGRHVVVEFGKASEGVDELRERTKRQFDVLEKGSGKRQKKAVMGLEGDGEDYMGD